MRVKTETIHIESRTERLSVVRDFVSDAARAVGFADDDVGKIALAVDEACTNIIKHAYKFDPHQDIAVTVSAANGVFEVRILDHGRTFDPTTVQPPNMKEYLTHFRRGGLGVHLMRSLMDKVEYSIVPGTTNEVRLTKLIPR
jgi:serine/threonine-protein kinase RsbW